MKQKQLLKQFLAYLAKNPPRIEDAHEPMAILYGTDELKLNFQKEAIRFQNRAWIPVPGLASHIGRVEWVAVVPEPDGAKLVFGEGPPFGQESAQHLPTKNGRILAAPAQVLEQMARQQARAHEVPPVITTPQVSEDAGISLLQPSEALAHVEPVAADPAPPEIPQSLMEEPAPIEDIAQETLAAVIEEISNEQPQAELLSPAHSTPSVDVQEPVAIEEVITTDETVTEPVSESDEAEATATAEQPEELAPIEDPAVEASPAIVAEAPAVLAVPAQVCEADPILRRGRLPLFVLAQLRKMKVGEVMILVNVRGPGEAAGDDSAGRAVALIEKQHSSDYILRGMWTLKVGRTATSCNQVWAEAPFKVLTSRRLEVSDMTAMSEALKVLRRCDHLSRSAKRAGDRESYSHLSPQLFEAHTRNASKAPKVKFLEKFAAPDG